MGHLAAVKTESIAAGQFIELSTDGSEDDDSFPDPWGAAYRFKAIDNAEMQIWSVGPNSEDENGAGDDIVERITIQPLAPEHVADRVAPGP